jgi:4-hydroxybenzoate polyprenyltransferase
MGSASDIQAGDWIDRLAPASLRPYLRLARLDRPIGIWLLLFPCWWSLALATEKGAVPDWRLMALFALGAIVMRGAGCTINDIVDRDIDAKVARTATRPLASGALSLTQAFVFLAVELGLGFAIILQLSPMAIGLGIASLALIAAYPFMKRITWWPQAFLGLTFNWGALMGWASVHNELAPAPLLLYAAGIAWTLFYDTIYAHQDKADDALAGIKSSALKLGERSRPFLFVMAVAMILLLALALAKAGSGMIALGGLAMVFAHLARQWSTVDFDNPKDCLEKFKSNQIIGWIMLAGIVIDRAVA